MEENGFIYSSWGDPELEDMWYRMQKKAKETEEEKKRKRTEELRKDMENVNHTKIEKDFAYLVDGKLRKLDKPKKKNIKHIQNLYIDDNSIKDKIVNGISDEEIKYFLKTFGGKNV